MHLMLQQEQPDDYVIATGKTYSVREFCETAFAVAGIPIEWRGTGMAEEGIEKKTGKVCLKINKKFYRPAEVDLLIGDASKAKKQLGWEPKIQFSQLVAMMVEHDLKIVSLQS
jgi:GDPmannose 4,6-dehydratase